jgi:hypothetical protein
LHYFAPSKPNYGGYSEKIVYKRLPGGRGLSQPRNVFALGEKNTF